MGLQCGSFKRACSLSRFNYEQVPKMTRVLSEKKKKKIGGRGTGEEEQTIGRVQERGT